MPTPTGLTSKPGLATVQARLAFLASFLGRYRNAIIAVVTVISPEDVTAVTAAIDAIVAASQLFDRIYDIWNG